MGGTLKDAGLIYQKRYHIGRARLNAAAKFARSLKAALPDAETGIIFRLAGSPGLTIFATTQKDLLMKAGGSTTRVKRLSPVTREAAKRGDSRSKWRRIRDPCRAGVTLMRLTSPSDVRTLNAYGTVGNILEVVRQFFRIEIYVKSILSL